MLISAQRPQALQRVTEHLPEADRCLDQDRRRHAVVELCIRDLKEASACGLLLRSGKFKANAAWLLIATLAHNLLRWVAAIGLGACGELVVAKTLRRTLLTLPSRLTRSARRLILHLPAGWPWSPWFELALARLRCMAYLNPAVLVVDEVGYLPLARADANLVFQLIARRYERGSILLTSNKAFCEWGSVFGDDVLASAILDRLLHRCDVIRQRPQLSPERPAQAHGWRWCP
jgi:hypothetical protein